jgi:hypothetical protein
MIVINESEAIKARLNSEETATKPDQQDYIASIVAMNEQMEAVRREYQVKDRNSQITASRVVLNA